MKTYKRQIPLEGDLPGAKQGAVYASLTERLISIHGKSGTLLVTSPERTEGKSTTAANLALSLLTRKLRVLLLEMTDGTPILQQVFGASPFNKGVEDVLRGTITLETIVCKRNDNGLLLAMMCGKSGLTQSDITDVRLELLLSHARKRCEWTVIDGPSCESMGSVEILSSRVSQTLLVIQKRKRRRVALPDLYPPLTRIAAPFVLLNG